MSSRVTMKTELRREYITAYAMLFPTVLSFLIFLYIPFIDAFSLGFYRYIGLTGKGAFIGLGNYVRVLGDESFFASMVHTFQLMVIGVGVSIPLGFIFAYVLYIKIPGRKAFHITLFIPYLISMVVVGSIWRVIYDPVIGPLNQALKAVGLEQLALPWLADKRSALWSIAVTWVWRSTPFNMLIFYANIIKMPEDFLEAADIDGANTLQKIFYVVIPYMGPTISALFMLSVTNALRLFDLVWVMTQGGPGGATEVMTSYIYRTTFGKQDFGTGTAASMILMIIMIAIMSGVNLVKWLRRDKEKTA